MTKFQRFAYEHPLARADQIGQIREAQFFRQVSTRMAIGLTVNK